MHIKMMVGKKVPEKKTQGKKMSQGKKDYFIKTIANNYVTI